MASLNTLRTKYGIVLSVAIGIVIVVFVLNDVLSNGNTADQTEEVVMKINGEEISNREYYEAGQNEAGVIYEYFYTPELKKVGLGGDESAIRSALAFDFMNQGYSEEDVLAMLNQTPSALIAHYAAVNSLGAGHYYNDLDVAAFEAAKNKAFSGRYVAYPYTSAEEVVVTDEEVKAYYDSLTLSNLEFGARSYIYVEFPHAAAVVEETTEDVVAEEATAANLEVEVRVNAFMQSVRNDVESFKKAAADAGLEYFSNTAKIADGMNNIMPLGSQELGAWVYYYAAEVGDVQKFVVGDRTYVVMVESVNEEEKLPYEECEAALRTMLYNQKVADSVIANMPATIEEGAEVVEFNGVKLADATIEDLHLRGAICSANAGDVIKVKGDKAAYLVVVDGVEEDANAVKAEANSYIDVNKNAYMQRSASAFDSNIDIEYISIEAPVR